MKQPGQTRDGSGGKTVRKPYLTGTIADENTVRNSLKIFGTLIIVFFVTFIACATATFSNIILRVLLNAAVVAVTLLIFYNNGAGYGADAVARGEILYQKQERGQSFSSSERKICFHPMKGFLTGLIGTMPLLILALILACGTSLQMTGAGTLPSWMQVYTRRSDIGNALVNYTNPEAMRFIDYIRAFVRFCILPYINIAGYTNKYAVFVLEKISPVLFLLPAASYGTGYMTGRKIRTRIHTAISENERKRAKRERKRRSRMSGRRRNEPEQLN